LIKKIHQSKFGMTIEWHDQMAALVHIGKALGIFPQKIEVEDLNLPSRAEVVKMLQEAEEELKGN
jgi:hypothetical protein